MIVNGFGIVFEILMAIVYLGEIFEFHDNWMPTIEIVIITVFTLITGKIIFNKFFQSFNEIFIF